nr:reverse transcriptase domain-containing protein [Tanacetum cinerariifolium]
MPKRWLFTTRNRLEGGIPVRIPFQMQPGIKRSGDKLYLNGEISDGLGTCQQATGEIFLSTPNQSNYEPADTAEDSLDTLMETEEELPEPWILFTDGSSCTDGSGAGLILTNPKGMEFTYALRFRFDATNNKAEYEALIAGLRIMEQIADVKEARAVRRKSQQFAVINGTLYKNLSSDHSNGPFPKGSRKVKFLIVAIEYFTKWIEAKAVAMITGGQVLVGVLETKSITRKEVIAVIEEEGPTWMMN